MRNATVTSVVPASRDDVFDFISEIENLPKWASEFARQLKHDQDGYKVINNLGELHFEIRADRDTGVIDMLAGPTREQMAIFPTRVLALPDGRTAYTFTMFQDPDMPDELFDSQHASLQREFENIERIFA